MFRKLFVVPVLVFGLILTAVTAQAADDLAAKLSADNTIVYARVDLKHLLDEMEKVLVFVDQESGGKIIHQVKELHRIIKEILAKHEFQPIIIDEIANVELYFVLMAKDEPVAKVHSFQMPKYDPETYEPIPGEFTEHSRTTTSYFTPTLILKTPNSKMAANLMEECKALLDREKEKNPESTEFNRKEIEVEKGELICDEEEESFLGRLDEYFVLSMGNPRELWAALLAPGENSLNETSGYKRLSSAEQEPQIVALVNIKALIEMSEQRLKAALDEAQKKVDEAGGAAPGGFNPASFQLMMAQQLYQAFMMAKDLLSLDKCLEAGLGSSISASENVVASSGIAMLAHAEGISPVLAQLLDGSGELQVPDIGKADNACMMLRLAPKIIYDEVMTVLNVAYPEMAQKMIESMFTMKQQFGADAPTVLDLFAGDYYLFLDMTKKEIETYDWEMNEVTGEWDRTAKKTNVIVPDPVFLCGVKDAQVARNTLSAIFTQLAMNPQFNRTVKKRTYQETDVFCMGPEVGKPDADPTDPGTFGLVVLDRYLGFGSWDHVTSLIRRFKAQKPGTAAELQAIVEQNAGANFLFVIPKAFQEKTRRLTQEQGNQQMEDIFKKILEEGISDLIEKLTSEDITDEATGQEIETALTELVQAVQTFTEKAQDIAPQTGVVTGKHTGLFYEIKTSSEARK